jgi:hypothetical protein
MDFPVILVCNLDPLTKDETIKSVQKFESPERMQRQLGIFSAYTEYIIPALLGLTSNFFSKFNKFELENKFMNPINETVLSCLFDHQICSTEFVSTKKMSMYGICLKIDPKKRVSKAGSSNGLNVDILIDSQNKANFLTVDRGLKIYIYNRSMSAPLPWNGGVDIQPGHKTNIQVDFYKFLQFIQLIQFCYRFLHFNL